jgi:hypothetical protein
MSWFSDGLDFIGNQFSSGSNIGSSIGDFINNNQGLIKGARQAYGMYDAYNNRSDTRNQLLNYYQQMDEANRQYYDQYNQWNMQNAASQSAAARANEAARVAAAQRAMGMQKETLKQVEKDLAPYRKSAQKLLPAMTKDYQKFLKSTGLLNAYLTPAVMQNMQAGVRPAWSYETPVAAYSAPNVVSAPNLDAIANAINEKKG